MAGAASAQQGRSPAELLAVAASANRADIVRHLLDGGTPADIELPNGMTALMVAAETGALDAARLLMARGADVNRARPGDGRTVLMMAARGFSVEMVTALLEKGAKADARDGNRGLTVLHHAADAPLDLRGVSTGDDALDIMTELIGAGADVNGRAGDGWSVLMSAADGGETARAGFLLDMGARIDDRSDDGRTALHVAARRGSPAMVRTLLQRGASHEQGVAAEGPLAAAIAAQSEDAARLLVEAGAAVDAKGDKGRTLLSLAAGTGQGGIVELLLSKGADANGRDADGKTALMWAANIGFADIVRLLLNAGADPSIAADDGWTAIAAAEQGGHDDLAALMRARAR